MIITEEIEQTLDLVESYLSAENIEYSVFYGSNYPEDQKIAH